MAAVNYDSPREIVRTLRDEGIAPKKRWGQNFLIDGNVRRAIVSLVERSEEDRLWEVGPGIGALTELLLQSGAVIAFEIDWGIIRFLERRFAGAPLSIIAGDAVQTMSAAAVAGGGPDVVVGNLPYRSAAPIISALADLDRPPRRMVLTVQKEMAERMLARPGVKSYSAFSVAVQSVFAVEHAFDIRPACFYPAPEVVSAVVALMRREDRRVPADRVLFRAVKDALFAGRRKTVTNNLRGRHDFGIGDSGAAEKLLRECGIDPRARAEQLSPDAFIQLADRLHELQQAGLR